VVVTIPFIIDFCSRKAASNASIKFSEQDIYFGSNINLPDILTIDINATNINDNDLPVLSLSDFTLAVEDDQDAYDYLINNQILKFKQLSDKQYKLSFNGNPLDTTRPYFAYNSNESIQLSLNKTFSYMQQVFTFAGNVTLHSPTYAE
jgi:hypothetical protein